MHIAVVIPAFNIAALSARPPFNRCWSKPTRIGPLVVVDDGSTDATAAVAAQLPGQADPIDQTAEFRGISRSECRQSQPPCLAGHVGAPTYCATARRIPVSGRRRLACPRRPGPVGRNPRRSPLGRRSGGTLRPGRLGCRRPPLPGTGAGRLLERLLTRNLFANGGHLLIRREAIEAAGDFRTDLVYGEDWEYWTRLAAPGEFVSVPSRSPLLFVGNVSPAPTCPGRPTLAPIVPR